jgi:hypothetical protein
MGHSGTHEDRAGGRVTRGLTALDEVLPSWPRRIDLATFDSDRPGRSLLVQLFGSMDEGLKRLGIPPDQAAAYAFLDLDWAEMRI